MSMLPTNQPPILQAPQQQPMSVDMPMQAQPELNKFQQFVQNINPSLNELAYQFDRRNLTPAQAIQADAMREEERRKAEAMQKEEYLKLLQMEQDAEYRQQGLELQKQELQLKRASMGQDLMLKRMEMEQKLSEQARRAQALTEMGYSPQEIAAFGAENLADMEIAKIEAAGEPRVFNQFELESGSFANRMGIADSLLKDIEKKPEFDPVNLRASTIGLLSGTLSNATMSPDQQKYANAASEFIRAKLRKESGATIGDDEARQEYATYFPVPGDGPQVIEQKKLLRENVKDNMRIISQGSYETLFSNDAKKSKAGGGNSLSNNVLDLGQFELEVDL